MRPLNFSRSSVPNLVIARRVLDKMAAAASHYIQDETGEAMVGLIVPGERTGGVDTLYVLDTISPDDSAVRMMHTFQQGDERQDEIIWWLQENWQMSRQNHRGGMNAKWDVPLRYLGDWHKQPGFMIAPSGGDQRTALDWLDDDENGMSFLLAPIVTLGHPSTTAVGSPNANFVALPQSDDVYMRVDFWYISRQMRMFQPIVPAIYPDDQLPHLAAYPWHLVKQGRVSHEFARLHEDELFTSVVLWNADGESPLEICILSARMGSDRVLIIVTPWNYPEKPPSARVAPFLQMGPEAELYDIFEDMWAKSQPVNDPPGWKWSDGLFLVDYIRALEASLGMKSPPPKPLVVAEADSPADTEEEQP
jgi:hypothetical protein